MREMLKAWECSFEEASDGWGGLDKLRASAGTSREFQLVLIDFQNARDGRGQLAAEIKRDPQVAHVPLILVTSVPQHGDAARMMNMGFEAYLTKPLKQSVLHDAVATVMGARSGERPRPALTLVTAHTVEERRARAIGSWWWTTTRSTSGRRWASSSARVSNATWPGAEPKPCGRPPASRTAWC